MHVIEIDDETFAEITRRRLNKRMSEGDVVRQALRLPVVVEEASSPAPFWESEGVRFPIGTRLEHRFRDGKIVEATIVAQGVEVGGTTYGGLSPAGVSVTGHQLNGWNFWFLRNADGHLVSADTLRKH